MAGQLVDREPNASAPTSMEIATTRQAQEVQAAMTVAKRFPRDETQAIQRIKTACKRKGLAEQAAYSYPKGGTKVSGPSIRLAEALAQAWGNIDYGIIELEQHNGESSVMAYAWDLETNTRQTKVFTVRHERHSKKGVEHLSDTRDIYETVANNGARRLRACILGIIPGDIVDIAEQECEKTLQGENSEPLVDRIRKIIEAFATFSVTGRMIEKRLGYSLEAIDERALIDLRKIYVSLKDGMSKREDWFQVSDTAPAATVDEVSNRMKGKKETPATSQDPTAKTDDINKLPTEATDWWDVYSRRLRESQSLKAVRELYDEMFRPEADIDWTIEQQREAVELKDKRAAEIKSLPSKKQGDLV